MRLFLAISLLTSLGFSQTPVRGHQSSIAGSGSVLVFSPNTVNVTPLNIGAAVGTTVQFTATKIDTLGYSAPACISSGWASASPGIATINATTGLATSVSVGTAVITCTDGSLTGNSSLISEASPNFSTPSLPCSGPCALAGGSTGVSYSYTLAASGGTPPYIFSTTLGTLPSGLNLAPGGAITGIPTIGGTTLFSIQVCDALAACSPSLQVSILVSSGCGPPAFTCSTARVDASPAFPSLTLAAVNSTGYAYSSPSDYYYPSSGHGNCYSRLSNAATDPSINLRTTPSGGGNELMANTDGSYIAFSGASAIGGGTSGSGVAYIHTSRDANGCMQTDSPEKLSPSGGVSGGFSFSRVTPNIAYRVSFNTGTKSAIYRETLSGTSTVTVVRDLLFDYNNCPGVNGTLSTQGGNGMLSVSSDDRYFVSSLNFIGAPSGQGNAHWVLAWDRTNNACTTYYTGQVQTTENPANGNIWGWCTGNCSRAGTNPAPMALDTSCGVPGYGIHNTQGTHNGRFSISTGKCNGIDGTYNVWELGTANIQRCSTEDNTDCGGHNSTGYSTEYFQDTTISVRFVANISIYTPLRVRAGFPDYHGSEQWVGTLADVNPWLVSMYMTNAGCAGTAYCNELMGIRQDGVVVRFGPNFHNRDLADGGDLGAISTMTTDGLCMIFGSNWNRSLGGTAGAYRQDIFAVCNLQ